MTNNTMDTLTAEQAAKMAYNSTATVTDANGICYLITCWNDEAAETILARASRFYGQEMVEITDINQHWQQEETTMTEQEAYDFVRSTFDDDTPDDDQLREAFVAIFKREPDEDEEDSLWSHLCSATTGLCGCSTRSEHESVHISDGVMTDDEDVDDPADRDAIREACESYARSYDHNLEDETHEVVARAKTCAHTIYFAFDSDGGFEWDVPASRYTTA
jgi:hypothetical protein